ncbi:glycoside hydrolase family 88 protein [Endozoicomonas atrinae]|uniref:glycoside hydrolase family 88 protein n=1 Tax=Endozoicomonas atrinae TaxID=1333660 RepID=UPI0008259945|nr:glycoside hydrolase family 88 protein [Endozoicomonas atrinae]
MTPNVNPLPPCPKEYDQSIFESHLPKVISALKRNIPRIGDRQPMIGTQDLKWQYCKEWNWVSGFWAGQLWLAHKVSSEQVFKNAARLQNNYMKNTLALRMEHNHDLGFVFSLSCVADYKLTGSSEARTMALTAADSLLGRYRRIGKYFVAWNEDMIVTPGNVTGRVIIDSLQNMALLFWASEQTGNPVYKECAIAHADTLSKTVVREDYTVYHTFNFDPFTQEPVGGENFQGYADESCWSRGMAWALHGYAQIYEYSKEARHLAIAKNLASVVASQLEKDPVPVWDYLLPEHETPYRDSSAGSCTASGLFLIAEHCDCADEAERFRKWGRYLLGGLIEQCDLSENPNAWGLLDEGAAFVHKGRSRNMLPYGDYYYMEALMRACGYHHFFW